MRKATRGLITACAGLVAGAAFGATPALAGPTWVPPGHILGYYGSPGACSSYATSLVLWDADYDCDYRPHRIAAPYALVIQRPVLITQPSPVLIAQPGVDHDDDEYDAPAEPAPVVKEPVREPSTPAPVVKEPSGSAQSEKPVKVKSHKKIKAQGHAQTKSHSQKQIRAMADEAPAPAHEAPAPVADCPPVTATCVDTLAVPVAVAPVAVAPVVVTPVRPVVPVIHTPLVGPLHHPWHY